MTNQRVLVIEHCETHETVKVCENYEAYQQWLPTSQWDRDELEWYDRHVREEQ